MPSAEHFAKFGFFFRRFPLDSLGSARFIDSLDRAPSVPGGIWNPHTGATLAIAHKKRQELLPDASRESTIKALFESLRDEIAAQFKQPLRACQPIKFARYDEGDFFGRHNDVTSAPDAPDIVRRRKVSLVLFLNEQADEPEPRCYGGGNLVFYGLDKEPPWNTFGRVLEPEAGLLIAFDPHLIHEVTPIEHGSRYSVVSWFE